MNTDQSDVLDRALKRFDEITSASLDERAMSLEDRRFVAIDGAQWEGDWGAQFENCLRVQSNKIQRGHDKVINDYRANRFTVQFRPVGDHGDDDTAELLNGLLYADMYRSKGQQALDNAFSEGAAGGMGAWRLCSEYEDDADPDNDHQRIRIEQVADADQRVFFDLDAKLYDKSDARFGYVLNSMTRTGFVDEYGEDRIASWPENKLQPVWYDWFRPDVVIVAEYYEIEHITRELRIYTRAATGEEFRYWAEDMADGMAEDLERRGFTKRSRKIKRKRVHKYILSGAEIIEDCGFIAGDRIPIVPFYGKRVFIDNIERFKGHVRDGKDPARAYNAQISWLMETASLSPREVPLFAPEQVEGLQNHWANMNLERHPYGLVHPLLDPQTGQIIAAGPISTLTPPALPPVLASLIQLMAADIAEITYGDDSSMEIKSNVSGEAMDIAASRVDAKSFIYMDNFKGSVQCFGEIYYGMAKDIYVEEGREVETMDEEGTTSTAKLHELYTNPATQVAAKRHDLSVGKFNVVADVTEATSTRRDKTVRTMMTFAEAAVSAQDMQTAQAAMITAGKNMDGEGIDDFQAYLHTRAIALGLDKPTPEEQQQMESQQQQPDPLAAAQAQAFAAQAGKLQADTKVSLAKVEQTQAQTVQTLADAALKHKQAGQVQAESAQVPAMHNVNQLMTRAA